MYIRWVFVAQRGDPTFFMLTFLLLTYYFVKIYCQYAIDWACEKLALGLTGLRHRFGRQPSKKIYRRLLELRLTRHDWPLRSHTPQGEAQAALERASWKDDLPEWVSNKLVR